jgi:poly(3-hydroxybutyrate) depolymerase
MSAGKDAADFADAAGWPGLADWLGAPLLLPEQVARNNQGRCFNWFERGDIARDGGEASSIRQMAEAGADLDGSRKTLRALITTQ